MQACAAGKHRKRQTRSAPAGQQLVQSRRFQDAPNLARGVGVRPQHGCPWDYTPGVYNSLVASMDLDTLKSGAESGLLTRPAPGAAPPKRGLEKSLMTRGGFLADMKASLDTMLGVKPTPEPSEDELWVRVCPVAVLHMHAYMHACIHIWMRLCVHE